MRRLIHLLLALPVVALPSVAFAQASATPADPAPPSATQGAPSTRCAPSDLDKENARPSVTTGQSDSRPLSDKLAAGNGVLCPPSGIDPQIRAPTLNAGKMPVIPPPGSPGGDEHVQPK